MLVLAFIWFGLMWGAWAALLPDFSASLGISTGPLGLALSIGFAASIPTMLFTGRLVDRFGVRPLIVVSALVMGGSLALAGGLAFFAAPATATALLVLVVVPLLAGSGAYDVAVNSAAMADATWSGGSRMALLHAGFSGGGAAGALGAGVAIGVGAPVWAVFGVVGASFAALAVIALRGRWTPPRAGGSPSPTQFAAALLPLAVIAGLSFLIEGSMETWAAIYLRATLGVTAIVGAFGPAATHASMMVGRLVGAAIAAGLGPQRTLVAAGVACAVGMLLALAAPGPALAIVGFGAAALGVSFVVPVAISVAARRATGGAGQATSTVLTLGYAGFLVGPPLVGLLAELVTLRLALLAVPLAALAIVATAMRRVGERR